MGKSFLGLAARWGWAFQTGRWNDLGHAKTHGAKMLSYSWEEQDMDYREDN